MARSRGRFYEIPALMPAYALQNIFLSAYCVPYYYFVSRDAAAPKARSFLKLAFSLLHAVSFIRVAQQLEASNATFLAGVTLALTASYVTHNSGKNI